ncbi:ABC transporter substrate-binding protein [Pelagibacterium sediminicola]|uniref:ABC transporter substrate-binding protein n=1 Tax=Pelagibacterium sediminicola TaxID=2248761 RepID=UPI000E32413A|nr:PhnD/SsuA/transferrin family substrate-binding protein [Pelagibacterium sediminicola]
MSTSTLSRRAVLAGSAGLALSLAAPAIVRAAPIARLALYGPPASPTITLAHAVATGALAELAQDISLTVWRNPDELRAGLTSGQIDLSVVPVQAAANLYNRGMGLRLVNVMTDGLINIVAAAGSIGGLADLEGKQIAVHFVNDTPDLILRALLDKEGLSGSVEIVATGSPAESAQLLLAGQIEVALLSEPFSTVAISRGKEAGLELARVIDIQKEWGGQTGLGAIVPQAGLAVTKGFSDNNADLIAPLHELLAQTTDAVIADPAAAAANASGPLELPAPVLATSIPHSALVARPAGSIRAEIEAMLSLMAQSDAAIIGGQLPDDGFYALS